MAKISKKATRADLIQLIKQLEDRVLDLDKRNRELQKGAAMAPILQAFWRHLVNAVTLPDAEALRSCREADEMEQWRLEKRRATDAA